MPNACLCCYMYNTIQYIIICLSFSHLFSRFSFVLVFLALVTSFHSILPGSGNKIIMKAFVHCVFVACSYVFFSINFFSLLDSLSIECCSSVVVIRFRMSLYRCSCAERLSSNEIDHILGEIPNIKIKQPNREFPTLCRCCDTFYTTKHICCSK